MVKLYESGAWLLGGRDIVPDTAEGQHELRAKHGVTAAKDEGRFGTMAYSILSKHNTSGDMQKLRLKFDALTSHDITFVSIVQTAKASGLERFPMPYVLTNCHNTLCAVGGTINEDDHLFGLSAAQKYGGIYVPPHMAVIHQYMREMQAGGGKMILGSDSHTRYGALGTMAIGEGGGELVKQLVGRTYDIDYPEIVGVYLTGKPHPGVGPQDIALAIVGAVFENGYVKNRVMEFVGDGIANLPTDYRNGIDVMTTETTCLSSIWQTDDDTRRYLALHGREEEYREIAPDKVSYYDGMIYIDLATIKPMIALPFHPSNTFEIDALNQNLGDILRQVEKDAEKTIDDPGVRLGLIDKIADGRLRVDQGIIAGCAGGTFNSIMAADAVLDGHALGSGAFSLSVYPASQPVMLELTRNGTFARLMASGAVIRTAFCGPCFGAGDVPANGAFSVRHTTRNFPNREGSKPAQGQLASVALMDARSIAATAKAGGFLTAASGQEIKTERPVYHFDPKPYESRVFSGFEKGEGDLPLRYGPNIVDWPKIPALQEHMLLRVASFITDPVTTTDELIPSGETSSYRSNPLGLAEFTLSRKDPGYVGRAKQVQKMDRARAEGGPESVDRTLGPVLSAIRSIGGCAGAGWENIGIASAVYAVKPGDGSAQEQAASCQRVLGGGANIARQYATKRYRSNLINWGMIPFVIDEEPDFGMDDYIFIPNVRKLIAGDPSTVQAYVMGRETKPVTLRVDALTEDEKKIILAGCLMNFYAQS